LRFAPIPFRADGSTEIHSDFLTTNLSIPNVLEISQAYPNPFSHGTTIPVTVGNAGFYILSIFNTRRQVVFSKANSMDVRGKFNFLWSGQDSHGNDLNSGSYIYQIRSGSANIAAGKLLMLK